VLGDLLAIATVEKPPASSRSPLKNSDQGDGRDLNSEEPRLLRRRPKRGPMKTELYLAHSGTQEDLSASQHRLAILGVLQDCWIPTVKQAGASQGTHICSTWLLSACTLSAMKEALPLSNSLLAMSLILLSGGQTDDTLVMESVRHYSQAVQGLKRLVDNELRRDVKEQTRDISLLTCLACASFEVLYSPFKVAIPETDNCRWPLTYPWALHISIMAEYKLFFSREGSAVLLPS